MDKFDLKNLNHNFLHRAQKISRFNVSDKDFQSTDLKSELQFLYASHIFPAFDWTKTLKGNTLNSSNVSELNRLIQKLRNESLTGFNELFKFKADSFGPGEVLIYILHDKVYLAGSGESGDIRIGTTKIELKACDKKVGTNQYYGFYLGGSFDTSDIVSRLFALKKKVGTTASASHEVGRTDIINMYAAESETMKKIEEDYAKIAYDNYFSKYPMMFIANKKIGSKQMGDILEIKNVKPKDVAIEALTSQKIKPFIKAS